MIKIAVTNQKGGVGKSTVATTFASISAGFGDRTLLIDADVQRSSESFKAVRPKDLPSFDAVSITKPTIDEQIDRFNYDKIFIDAGARDNAVFRSAIMASNAILIPITPGQYDIWSSEDTFEAYKEINSLYKKAGIPIKCGVILNMIQKGTVLSNQILDVIEEFKERYDVHVFNAQLHFRVAYRESASEGKSVLEMPGKKYKEAAFEIMDLYNEVMSWVV